MLFVRSWMDAKVLDVPGLSGVLDCIAWVAYYNCTRILNMPKTGEKYPNVDKYPSIYLTQICLKHSMCDLAEVLNLLESAYILCVAF